jgi:tellurite resistance protein TerB
MSGLSYARLSKKRTNQQTSTGGFMPSRQQDHRRSISDYLHALNGSHAEMLFENVVAACALIAYADGWVTPDEQRRMRLLVRGYPALSGYAPEDLAQAFDEISTIFERDYESGEKEALKQIARLRGRDKDCGMLMRLCCEIAAADGVFDAEERLAAQRICKLLDLNPADFDLDEI